VTEANSDLVSNVAGFLGHTTQKCPTDLQRLRLRAQRDAVSLPVLFPYLSVITFPRSRVK